jgi:hypothetical protein
MRKLRVYKCIQGGEAMRDGRHEHRGLHGHGRHGDRHEQQSNRPEGGHSPRPQSAQTFRRGRAIAFYERLLTKRATLIQQLGQPEYESIKTVISGELKATEAILQEFIQAFELHEAAAEPNFTSNGEEDKYDSTRTD